MPAPARRGHREDRLRSAALDQPADALCTLVDLLTRTSSDADWIALEEEVERARKECDVALKQHWAASAALWARVVNIVADASFARNLAAFLRTNLRDTKPCGRPAWIHREDGLLGSSPDALNRGYNEFFEHLYAPAPGDEDIAAYAKVPRDNSARWHALSQPFSDGEVLQALRHFRSRTAPSPDNLPAPLLKSLLDERDDNGWRVSDPIIARALSALWNRCLVQRCVPHAWKLSHFTLLPKNDKGRAGDPAAMRPLAVASILYCGLMWLLSRRLLGPTSDILPDSQRISRRSQLP